MIPYVKITKGTGKQPFRLQEFGANGEKLNGNERYATRAGIKTNLLAKLKLYTGTSVFVKDHTYEGGIYEYYLFQNGRVNPQTPRPRK